MSWLLLTITAIGYIAVVSFSSIANAETADQEKCAADAKRTFEELESAYAAELNQLQLTIEVVSSDYKNHYNSKIDRCMLLINKTTSSLGERSNTSYLLDADERRMYGAYVETAGKMSSCMLIRSVRQVTACKS
jgi:hypothetical protein